MIRVVFEDGKQLGRKLESRAKVITERVIKATQLTARVTAANIERRGRAQMKRAGKFGSARWQEGFRALVSFVSRSSLRIRITHSVPYWKIFQFGGVIKGKPMLWIPLSFAADAQGIRARDYPGDLFKVERPGKAPLLLGGRPATPKYFGKESVTMPKKFRLVEISKEESRKMGTVYRAQLKKVK